MRTFKNNHISAFCQTGTVQSVNAHLEHRESQTGQYRVLRAAVMSGVTCLLNEGFGEDWHAEIVACMILGKP